MDFGLTVVACVALLLDAMASIVSLVTVAVLLIEPVVAGAVTTMVNVAVAALASEPVEPFEHATVPFAPTAGVVQVHPAGLVTD